MFNCRSIFGAQKIQRRLSDDSEDDELEEENRSKTRRELSGERKTTRRKATDILAEVSTLPTCLKKTISLNPFTPKSDVIDFTLSNARRFYSSKEDPRPCSQGLSSNRPLRRARRDPGLVWSGVRF